MIRINCLYESFIIVYIDHINFYFLGQNGIFRRIFLLYIYFTLFKVLLYTITLHLLYTITLHFCVLDFELTKGGQIFYDHFILVLYYVYKWGLGFNSARLWRRIRGVFCFSKPIKNLSTKKQPKNNPPLPFKIPPLVTLIFIYYM